MTTAVFPHDEPERAPRKFSREFHKTTWILLKDLCVKWAQSQRDYSEKKADEIAADFDPDLFGALAVSLPDGKGKHHVIDGQHRREGAAKCFDPETTKVPCIVLACSDPVRAAELFDRINTTRRGVNPLEKYKTRVTSKQPDYVAVENVVRGLGYAMRNAPGASNIRCVDVVMRAYRSYGADVLRKTIVLVRDTWGEDDASAMCGPIIAGYAIFVAEHGAKIDGERLADKIAKRYTPQRLWGAARQRRDMLGGSAGSNVAYLMVDTYNAGLRMNRLNGKGANGQAE